MNMLLMMGANMNSANKTDLRMKRTRNSIFDLLGSKPKTFDSIEGQKKSAKLLWLQFLSLAYNSDKTNVGNGAFDAPDWLMLFVQVHQTTNLLVVFTSIFLMCIESLPMFYRGDKTIDALNLACILYFIMDLVLKFCAMRKRDFTGDAFTWIDALTLVPFFLERITDGLEGVGVLLVFRVLRLTRVFRVLKLSKFNEEIHVVFSTILKSGSAMRLLVFLFAILVTVLSSFIFFVEQMSSNFREDLKLWVRSDDTISPYQSIPHSMWWCVVTLTTVGYGDDVPTHASQVIASFTIFMGTITLAFPTIILSTNFAREKMAYDERKRIRNNRARRKILTLVKLIKTVQASSREPFVTFERSTGGEPGVVQRKDDSYTAKPWRYYVFESSPYIKRAGDGSIENRNVDPCTILLTIVTAASAADISAANIKVREKIPDAKQLSVMPLHPTAMKIVTNLAEIAPYATVISPSWCDDCSGPIPLLIRTRTPSQVQTLRDNLSGLAFTPRVSYDEISRRTRTVIVHYFALNGMMDALLGVESGECFLVQAVSFEKNDSSNGGPSPSLPRRLDIAYVATSDLQSQVRASVPTLPCVKACIRKGMRLANRNEIADVIVRQFRKQCPLTTHGRLTSIEKTSLIDRGNAFREGSEIIQLDTKMFDRMTLFCVTRVETAETF